MTNPQAAHTDKLWPLIKDLRFPMFTTRRSDGGLQSRPMIMQNRYADPLDYLWFFVPRDSDQVADLQWDSSVGIVFADPDNEAYVAVFGSASVVEDAARKRLLWSQDAESWFPGGPEDPALSLVRVRIIQADCWDVRRNTVVHLFKLDTSAMTYKPPPERGDSGAMRH
jgi:general stress protein 26